MIPEIGHFALILALCLAFVLAVFPLYGIHQNTSSLLRIAKPAVLGQLLLLGLSFGCLVYAFITDDFSVKYVADNSNTQLPLIYKISATWGAHEGSLLLWGLILAIWTFAASVFSKPLPEKLTAIMLSILGIISIGFLFFVLLTSNPFERLMEIPQQGRSLNPLLQDIGLAIHPPVLYLGYVGIAIAFAFSVAVLLQGEFKMAWANWAKNFTLIAWAFLTLGIALGSWWAYYELGWGGWWFWDPVENASLLPWIVATALIHSLGVTAKRGIFQSWTILLAIVAFGLSLLGTFLVRSGVLTSVHAFSSDPSRGVFILLFLVIIVGSSLWIYSIRAHKFNRHKRIAFLSKESLLLLNNVLLVTIMATVLLGTLYPLILDALGIAKISVGAPYFNTVIVPLTIPLALAMGAGFAMQWIEESPKRLIEKLRLPLLASLLTAFLVPLLLLPELSGLTMMGLFIASWVAFAALAWLIQQNQQQTLSLQTIGASLAHIGFAVTLTGITITSLYSIEKDLRMEPGSRYQIHQYEFEFTGIEQAEIDNYLSSKGTVIVYENGTERNRLYPEKRVYLSQTMPMTEADIDVGFSRDLFVALGEELDDGAWALRIQYKPFIRWIWLGAILMALGALISASHKRLNRPKNRNTAYHSSVKETL